MSIRAKQLSSDSSSLFEIAELIKEISGLNLNEDKFILIDTRLRSRLQHLGIGSFGEYVSLLRSNQEEQQVCIEHLTTHKTSWFREIEHFQWLKKQISTRTNNKPLSIWSAACSRGPEVYSLILLCLKENLAHTQFKVLGTDISEKILAEAKNLSELEEFNEQAVRAGKGLSEKFHLELKSAVDKSIKFRRLNLTTEKLASPMQFEIIFLRNVLIYFDKETIIRCCRNLSHNLQPGGHLVIGLSESLPKELTEFRSIGNSIYVYEPGKKRAS